MPTNEPSNKDSALVESVAQAIYMSQVDIARKELEKTTFDLSDFPEIFGRLSQESETAQVLIFGSYLEDKITEIIKSKMHHLSSREETDNLFGANGPLSSLSSRILISYQLGWISKETKHKLDAFRKIRNHFAHKAYRARINDPEIANFLSKIDYNPERMLTFIAEAIGKDDTCSVITLNELTTQKRYLSNFAYLAEHVFRDMLVLPVALAYRVDPRSLCGGYDESPKIIQQMYRLLSKALMSIIIKSSDPKSLDETG